MPLYKVKYKTQNTYQEAVTEAFFYFLVFPQNLHNQWVIDYKVHTAVPSKWWVTTNMFDGRVLALKPQKPFNSLEFIFESLVQVESFNPFERETLPLEEEQKVLKEEVWKIENYLYLHHATEKTDIGDASSYGFPAPQSDESLFDYLKRLNTSVYEKLTYNPEVTTVHSTAAEIVNTRMGVCQDYAHLFIGLARHWEIPCRYVCGYLHQGHGREAQLHAWVECNVPGMGWIGLDPTNNLLADHHYIKISHGRDYDDCPPIRGVIRPGSVNETTYSVEVKEQEQ